MRRGLRQRDLAVAAGVSQSTVSLVERGQLAALTVSTVRAVASVLDVWLPFEPRWRGAELPRLLDERHANLVGRVVEELRCRSWQVRVEYSSNWRGERGSVDVLAWLAGRRAVLLVEVKKQVVDVQELLSTLDRKRRLVPGIVSGEVGWRPVAVGCVVVLPEETRARSAISRHASVFEASLAARNVAIRRWLNEPAGPLAGIWFLRYSNTGSRKRAGGGLTRVRAVTRAQSACQSTLRGAP